MRQLKRAAILVLLAIFTFMLGQFSYYTLMSASADADGEAVFPSASPTPDSVVVFEIIPTPTIDPAELPTPYVTCTPNTNFVVKEYKIPRELEAILSKVLWYSPIKSQKSHDPNFQKFGLLWVLANEYECELVKNAKGEIVKYSSLSAEDQRSNNFTWLFERSGTVAESFEKILMRKGDHDWYRTAVETNQPWHESETNKNIIQIWYNVWMSEKEGLYSGRTVPREYIFYAFTPDNSGVCRNISLYKTKEDLVAGENAYNWSMVGTLDNQS